MENIYSYAIKAAVKTNSLNVDQLCELVDSMPDPKRFTEVIIGIENLNETRKMIPSLSSYAGEAAKLKGYNPFSDTVRFDYTQIETRYFSAGQAAEKFRETGQAEYKAYQWSMDDDFCIASSYPRQMSGEMSRSEWVDNVKRIPNEKVVD